MIEFASFSDQKLQNAFNAIRTYLTRLRSVPCQAVADIASLPPAGSNPDRIFIVDDIGAGVTGIAVSRGGVWKTGALT